MRYNGPGVIGVGMASPTPTLSVVLPAHNEQDALPIVVQAIASHLGQWSYEIIVIDDGSTDGTWTVIQRLKGEAGVRGLRFTRNFGHQAAILAGLHAARGEAVIMMDADGQHPADLLATFIQQWQAGMSVVQGVRRSDAGAGAFKRWSGAVFYRILRGLAGVDIQNGSADFRLLARPVLDQVLASAGPLLFLRGLVPWLGYETAHVPFDAAPRIAGSTSYTLRRMVRFSVDGLLGFSIIPLRLAIALGFVISATAFLYLVYVVGIRLTAGNVVPGWASMTGLLSLLGGIQLLTLGVLGEYVGRLFLSTLNRPHYVIRDQLGADSPSPGGSSHR
jgi:glycosyltransferase involved in cell wall biosynthesis